MMQLQRRNFGDAGPTAGRIQAVLIPALALFFAVGGTLMVDAQSAISVDPSATVESSVDSVRIAEPFVVTITVAAPTGAEVDFPPLGEKHGSFDILASKDIFDIPVGQGQTRHWKRLLTLESIDTGQLEFPALQIIVRNARNGNSAQISEINNSPIVLSTQPLLINVRSVLEDRADPANFRDIHSVVDFAVAPPDSYGWLWWTVGGIGALLAALTIAAWSRRAHWKSPAQWAAHSLGQLSVDTPDVANAVVAIMRDYLHLQFEINAPLQTSRELISALQKKQIFDDELIADFAELFSVGDQTKFAGLALETADKEKLIEDAGRLVAKVAGVLEQSSSGEIDPDDRKLDSDSTATKSAAVSKENSHV